MYLRQTVMTPAYCIMFFDKIYISCSVVFTDFKGHCHEIFCFSVFLSLISRNSARDNCVFELSAIAPSYCFSDFADPLVHDCWLRSDIKKEQNEIKRMFTKFTKKYKIFTLAKKQK
jgi:Skp family chaperone for outer membrane proteins